MAKLNQARRDLIAKLRKNGMTYAEIGAILNPPCSRQLVHQTMQKIVDKSQRKAYK